MQRPTVALFDVDGTLLTSDGAGKRAVYRALEAVYGPHDGFDFGFGGMTDRLIVRTALRALDVPVTEAAIDHVLQVYLDVLAEEVSAAERYRVHDGIMAALQALAQRPEVAIGLGTGNLEAGARIKLERVGLNPWFDFGGYGSDAEDRTELIRVGAERGAARLGRERRDCRVVIIGDTPRDVLAAHGCGAECLAVATGAADEATLRATAAEHVFPDLAAPGALAALLG
jgi:phosphoglycolate phosphatase-like HAD superfamily hydrolase